MVVQHPWLTLSEFTDLITIAEMTPGPIGINSATFVGIRIGGILGALLASLGAIQPGREDEEDKKLGVIRKAQGRSYSTYFKLGDWSFP